MLNIYTSSGVRDEGGVVVAVQVSNDQRRVEFK